MKQLFKYNSFLLFLLIAVALCGCSSEPIRNNPHNIHGVNGFQKTFSDNNDVQMAAAKSVGVSPVAGLKEAQNHKKLVEISSRDEYKVDSLTHSLPYLTKGASALLKDIGESFLDSLENKGLNPNKIVVTSVLRTQELIKSLRQQNVNSIENSTHCYGTTFDLSWKTFEKVEGGRRPYESVSADTLKLVLAEVLRDFRNQGRCYVKYEVKQACFHITSRE